VNLTCLVPLKIGRSSAGPNPRFLKSIRCPLLPFLLDVVHQALAHELSELPRRMHISRASSPSSTALDHILSSSARPMACLLPREEKKQANKHTKNSPGEVNNSTEVLTDAILELASPSSRPRNPGVAEELRRRKTASQTRIKRHLGEARFEAIWGIVRSELVPLSRATGQGGRLRTRIEAVDKIEFSPKISSSPRHHFRLAA